MLFDLSMHSPDTLRIHTHSLLHVMIDILHVSFLLAFETMKALRLRHDMSTAVFDGIRYAYTVVYGTCITSFA